MDKLNEHLTLLKSHVKELEDWLNNVKHEINILQELIFEQEDNTVYPCKNEFNLSPLIKDEVRRIFSDLANFKD